MPIPTFVQGKGTNGSGTVSSASITFTSNVTAGNYVIGLGFNKGGVNPPSSVQDGQGNTYHLLSNTFSFLYWALIGSSGSLTPQTNFPSAAGVWGITMAEYTNVSSVDTASSASTPGGSGGPSAAPFQAITLTNANETVVWFVEDGLGATSTLTAASGSTVQINNNLFNMADQNFSSSGSNTIHATSSLSTTWFGAAVGLVGTTNNSPVVCLMY